MRLPTKIHESLRKPDIPAYNPKPMWDTNYSHVVLIILDGVSQSLFQGLRLPNLHYLCEQGAVFSNCLTTFPTITGSAHTSIHTGCYQETHNYGFPVCVRGGKAVPANNGKLDFAGYISNSLKANGLSSASISDATLKGAFYSLYAEGFVGHSIPDVAQAAIDAFRAHKPNYLTVTFYATDTISHRYGPDHEYVQMALMDIDAEIGRIIETIDSMNLLDKTVMAISADHGFASIKESINPLVEPLIKDGLLVAPNLRCLVAEQYPASLVTALGKDVVDRVLGPEELRLLGFEGDKQNFVVCLKEGYTWQYDSPYQGNHGGFTSRERTVPLVFYGAGIPKNRFDHVVEVIDIAPTITALLGGEPSKTFQGRYLPEILGKDLSRDELLLTEWRGRRERQLLLGEESVSCNLLRQERDKILGQLWVENKHQEDGY